MLRVTQILKQNRANVTRQTLQQSETYQTVSQLTDWDAYFAQKRQQLGEQVDALVMS